MSELTNKRDKFWNKDFFLLWQGQLFSDLGNSAFMIVLGFWVLDITGSTAIMGMILACFSLPRVLLGPFAGAFADRSDRKMIIVFSDLFRGLLFTLMGFLIIIKVFPFWLLFPFALIIGFLGSFFGPAVASVVPDIVKKEHLPKANSARGIAQTATQLVGNSFGGLLYVIFSGPIFFLINGVGFIFSAITEAFIKIPHSHPVEERKHILHDMALGFKYAWKNVGIRILLITGMFINFFVTMGVTLLPPLFKNTPGFGVERYGFTMGSLMTGSIVGMLILSTIKIGNERRFFYYRISTFLLIVCMIMAGITRSFSVILVIGFFAGIFNSTISILTQTVLQITVPQENRGKVFGIMGTMTEGLSPIAMALSGIVAQFLDVRPTIIGVFCLAGLTVLPSLFSHKFCQYMNSKDTIHHVVSSPESMNVSI